MDTKETPMTDAVLDAMDYGSSATWVLRGMVPVEFARQLERELAGYAEDKSRLATMVLDLREQRDRLVEALEFINEECDWEPYGGGGDERIGACCEKALAAVKPPTTESHE